MEGSGPGHRRALRRPDRARARRPGRRVQGRRARPRRLRRRPARHAARGRPGRRQGDRRTACRPRRRPSTANDQTALAAARGTVRAGLFRGAYAVITEATARGDAATAKRWLLLREYRTATRFTRPGAQATLALDQLAARQDHAEGRRAGGQEGPAGRLPGAAARAARRTPATASSRTSRRAAPRPPPRPRATSRSSRRATPRTAARPPRSRRRRRSTRCPAATDLAPALDAADKALEGFTAAPFTPEEAARRAQQLLQFLSLVPVEYGRGVKGDQRHHATSRSPRRSRSAPAPSARSATCATSSPSATSARTERGRRGADRARPAGRDRRQAEVGRADARPGREGRRPGRRRR